MCVQPFGWCQPMRVDGCMFSRLAGVNLCVLTDVCSEQDVHIQATHSRHKVGLVVPQLLLMQGA